MNKYLKGLLLGLFIVIVCLSIYIGIFIILSYLDKINIFSTDVLGRHFICTISIIVIIGAVSSYDDIMRNNRR